MLFTSIVLLNCSFVVIPSCHIVILLIIRLHIYPRKIKFYKLCHKIRITVEQYLNSIKQIGDVDDLLAIGKTESMISRRGSRSFSKECISSHDINVYEHKYTYVSIITFLSFLFSILLFLFFLPCLIAFSDIFKFRGRGLISIKPYESANDI